MVPSNVICRPLKPSEYRVEGAGGKHYIFEESTQQMVPEAPDDVEIGALPCLGLEPTLSATRVQTSLEL